MNVDAREVADLASDHRAQFTEHVRVLDDVSSESSSVLQYRFYSQNKDPHTLQSSRFTRENNGAIAPTDPNGTKNKEYKASEYLKIKGQTKNAAITAVKRQLGRHYQEDGLQLVTEFEALPLGAFELASSNPMNEPLYVGNSKWFHSPDLLGVQKHHALGTVEKLHKERKAIKRQRDPLRVMMRPENKIAVAKRVMPEFSSARLYG